MKGNRGEEERFRPRFRFVASLAEGPARLSRASQVLFSFQVKVVEAARTLDRRAALPLGKLASTN